MVNKVKIDRRNVNLSEKDIEDWVYANPSEIQTWMKTRVISWLGRQVKVPSGIIDLLGIDEMGNAVILEIKNTSVDASALTQVSRYAQDIHEIIGRYDDVTGSILKMVLGNGEVDNRLLFEAHALNIGLINFAVELNLSVSGTWHFTREFRHNLENQYDELSKEDPFVCFCMEEYEDQKSDIVQEAERIISEDGEDEQEEDAGQQN